jgi:hypothetical protein
LLQLIRQDRPGEILPAEMVSYVLPTVANVVVNYSWIVVLFTYGIRKQKSRVPAGK